MHSVSSQKFILLQLYTTQRLFMALPKITDLVFCYFTLAIKHYMGKEEFVTSLQMFQRVASIKTRLVMISAV